MRSFCVCRLFIVFLFFFSCNPIVSEEDATELFEEQKTWFEFLCSEALGGRYSGSRGIKEAANFISQIIDSDTLERVSFEGKGVTMENLILRIQGRSDSAIVVGAHYDAFGFINKTPLPGADDNISGVVILLNMIKQIQNQGCTPDYSLVFCFFDGEEIGRFGSDHFVKTSSTPIKLYINVDTCGSEKDYYLTVSYNSLFPRLRDSYSFLSKEIGAAPIMEYGPLGYTTDCEPFAKANIPFIAIGPSNIPYYLHSRSDDISHISFLRLDTISKELVSLLLQ